MSCASYKVRLLLIILGSCLSSLSSAALSVWDVVSSEFGMYHEESRPEVQEQIRWLVEHPGYIQKVCSQSRPYIYHILTEIKKQRLPGELALLPMLESAYDPFAYSRVGAAGLWQLMPATARELGVKQDWWFDGRRSVSASTQAALTHLAYLNKTFAGSWLLAIAAYDAGEGTMNRAIRDSARNTDFWHLAIPRETQIYVPRFLALAEVIKNPGRYHITLPYIPFMPYFEEVNVGSPIDLNHAASLAGITYNELIRLNPGFNRWITAPYAPFHLLIPAERAWQFSQSLSQLPKEKRVSWVKYQAQKNDNLFRIAVKYHTTVTLIKQLNQLEEDTIKPYQVLLIPSSQNTSPAAVPVMKRRPVEGTMLVNREHRVIHIVQLKDSLESISKKYAVTAEAIQQWNPALNTSALTLGQQLLIWRTIVPKLYKVHSGDSLSGIAQNNHTSIQEILALNPDLQRHSMLHAGQSIRVS
jgi:membrane-bound lytic murein transglycosylase D